MLFFSKNKFVALFLAFVLLISCIPFSASAYDPTVYSGPVKDIIINLGRDPSARNLTWHTQSGAEMHVQWVEAESAETADFSVGAYSAEAGKETENEISFVCRAKMTGLKSNTSYAYRVGADECGWSDVYTFKTGDFNDGSFSFLFIGDAQIGAGGDAANDAERWNATLEKARSWFGDRVEFLLSAGDQSDDDTIEVDFDGYCSPAWFRSLPQLDLPGNHDNGEAYSNYFTFDNVDDATRSDAGLYGGDYWVAYDGALIITLNTNEWSRTRHIGFIRNAIEEYTALYGEPNWKVVSFHHSAYSAAASRLDDCETRREILAPGLSELGIDVVLMGHDHIYTRAYMQRGMASVTDPEVYTEVAGDPYGSIVDPDGGTVFYLTANSSTGSKYYGMYYEDLPYVAVKNQENTPNFTKIDVTPDSITFRTFRSLPDNEMSDAVDFFAIRKTSDAPDVYAPFIDLPSDSVYASNEIFDPLEGVLAYDNRDGDLTDSIKITGKADPCCVSVLTYTVTDAAGNTATAYRTVRPYIEKTVVCSAETVWKYIDDGSAPFEFGDDPTEWTLPDFDDSGWAEGKCSFGTAEPRDGMHSGKKENVTLPLLFPKGSDEEGNVIPNYFFRTAFDLDDPASVDRICARLFYDDGFDIYINGVLVRTLNTQNAPDKLGYCYCNSGGDASGDAIVIDDPDVIASLGLRKKGNVLAVELYQSSGYSDDVFFDFDHLTLGSSLNGMPFNDVKSGKWYYFNVGKAYCRGLFSGVTPDTFAPNIPFTRAMAWTVIAKMSGAKTVKGDKWYSGAQVWAVENGISDGTMPDGNITRQQLALMLYNLAGKPEVHGTIDGFTDASSASSWARTALAWAVERGIMSGRGNGVLDPKANATRAEACTVFIKYIEG